MDQSFQRRGVGRALLDALAELEQSLGLPTERRVAMVKKLVS